MMKPSATAVRMIVERSLYALDAVLACLIASSACQLRWGGGRRLSGFLPIQSIYADFYVIDELWPDFSIDQFHEALAWYQEQDVTLGG
jgi:undecaprenyl diphosphate synthase